MLRETDDERTPALPRATVANGDELAALAAKGRTSSREQAIEEALAL